MSKKAYPEKVHPKLARMALAAAPNANCAYTQCVLLHYRSTGYLAPGFDARDLVAWYRANMPDEWKAKGGK